MQIVETPAVSRRQKVFGKLPSAIDFDIGFEPSKAPEKKYIMDTTNGRYLDTVGNTFNCVSHPNFFGNVQDSILKHVPEKDLKDASVTFNVARHGAWAMMDLKLPNVTGRVITPSQQVDIGQRIIALHGIDGSCSNQVYYGAIDFFCTNGMITGDWSTIRRKNTSGFNIDQFIDELRQSQGTFTEHVRRMNGWAQVPVTVPQVQRVLGAMIPSERKQDKLLNLFSAEVPARGSNKFALYSAFTNYASYADDRNGFKLRDTGKDTGAVNMWGREQEVSQWISSKPFTSLVKEAA